MRQLLLRKPAQHVALVLLGMPRAQKPPASGRLVLFHAGVVPRDKHVEAQLFAPSVQRPELHVSVAVHARVRGPAIEVVVDKPPDHALLEGVLVVEDEVLDPQPAAHLLRVVHLVHEGVESVPVASKDVAPEHLARDARRVQAAF